MRRLIILGGIAVMALLAAGLTEVTIAISPRHASTDQVSQLRTSPEPQKAHTSTESPSPTPTAPVVSVSPTPAPKPISPQAVTNGFVHLRAQPNTQSAIIQNLQTGTVVTLGSYKDSQWQGVTVGNVSGYVYRSYLNY